MAGSTDEFALSLCFAFASKAGHWGEAQHTCAVLSRIQSCLQQLCNVANVGRHLEFCSRRIPGVDGRAILTRQRWREGVRADVQCGVCVGGRYVWFASTFFGGCLVAAGSKALVGWELCHGPVSSGTAGSAAAAGMDQALKLFCAVNEAVIHAKKKDEFHVTRIACGLMLYFFYSSNM